MSLSQELQINNLLDECARKFLMKHENESYETQSQDLLENSYKLISHNERESLINFSTETMVKFCEIALKIKPEYSEKYIDQFIELNQSQGQMYIRGLLIKAQLMVMNGQKQLLKAEKMIENIKSAIKYVQKALDLVSQGENKFKYSFLIYNCSVCFYQIIRPMLRPNWSNYFVETVERIVSLFDEIYEIDFNWRCKYQLIQFQCLYDTPGKAQNAFKILDKIWDNVLNSKQKGKCEFMDTLFRIRIHYQNEFAGLANGTKKLSDSKDPKDLTWKQLHSLQSIKSELVPESTIEKELINMINTVSSSVMQGQEATGSSKLDAVSQQRLAEAGRVALNFNLINIADSITNFLGKVSQMSQKALVLHEYNKAELFIKKAGSLIDDKTGMRLNSVQIKQQEIERRHEALKILEKTKLINKQLQDPELIYEGAILIWNISLPFLNQNYRKNTYNAFDAACQLMDQIEGNDHQLRVNLHLELAKQDLEDDQVMSAQQHVNSALKLDPSIPLKNLEIQQDQDEDLGLYQRPYERYLFQLRDKLNINSNSQSDNQELEKVILDIQQASQSNTHYNQKIDLLQKSLGVLVTMKEKTYKENESRNLVSEEIQREIVLFKQKQLQENKQIKLLASEIAKIIFEFDLKDLKLATQACKFVVQDSWEIKNSHEMILAQVECYFTLSKIYIQQLEGEGFEIAFNEPKRKDDLDDNGISNLSDEKLKEIYDQKVKIIECFINGLKLADSIKQTWLIFNGAIIIWNQYLNVFKNPTNDNKLLPDIQKLLKEFFEIMRSSLKDLENKKITDYDLDSKILVFANIGLVYARLMEAKQLYDEVMKICEALLLTPLNPHTRKLINSIKARNQGNAKGGIKEVQKKDPKKGGEEIPSDSVIFDVHSQLEIIQNTSNKQQSQELIKKCFETLKNWTLKTNDETELELHAELWARLARQALNEENMFMYKYSLRCVEKSLSFSQNKDLDKVPPGRLRWYALAEYLYSETLMKMINGETQEPESQQKLMFYALKHAVDSAQKGDKAKMSNLVLDAAKQIWNIASRLQDSAQNRKLLIRPLFCTLFYLKSRKETSEPDLILLLSQLLFKAALENQEYELGENTADMVFQLIPKNLQKPIWEAKLIFMSKQGKNELQAISNMKENDSHLQAKIWIKLARSASNIYKQYQAYNKAIEILKKENSVEIVEILIEFSEWLLRNKYENEIIRDNLLIASDILLEIEMDETEDDQDDNTKTIFSRCSRGKNNTSRTSRSKKSELSQLPKQKSKSNKKSKSSTKSKSLFTQKEEDPFPEQLNCSHYERLFRIHAMLAIISQTQEQQIQHCLDAKYFIQKIFQLSFKTLQNIEQNTAKYSNIGDQREQQLDIIKLIQKYQMPKKVSEWINLQFNKEFIEKVKNYEDYNFMGKFIFERAEMTYYYANIMNQMLERTGLLSHSIVFLQFMRFLSKEIINNPILQTYVDLKYSRILSQMNFIEQSQNIYNQLNIQDFKINDKEQLLEKTRNQQVQNLNYIENQINPHLIQQFKNYELWLEISKELIKFGELSLADELLEESIKHAKVLKDLENIGLAYQLQGTVYYQQGKFSRSLQKLMESHKFIKKIEIWEQNVIQTSKVLQKMGQCREIYDMGLKMKRTFEDLKNKQGYEGCQLSIQQLITILDLICIYYKQNEWFDKLSYSQFDDLMGQMVQVQQQMNVKGVSLIQTNYYLKIIKLFIKKISQFELCDNDKVKFGFKMIERISKVIIIQEKELRRNLKYVLLLDKSESFTIQTSLHRILTDYKLQLAICFIHSGICKQIMRRSSFEIEVDDEEEEKVEQKQDDRLQMYLRQLEKEIESKLMPIPYRLESFEKAVALLTVLQSRCDKQNGQYQIIQLELSKAKRLLAENKNQMKNIWQKEEEEIHETDKFKQALNDNSDYIDEIILQNEDEKTEMEFSIDYRMESLQTLVQILEDKEYEQQLINYYGLKQSLQIMSQLYMEALESFGNNQSNVSFNSLAKCQHMKSVHVLFQVYRKYSQNDDKFKVLEKEMKRIRKNQMYQQNLIKDLKVYKQMIQIPDNQQLHNILPEKSSYLIVHMSDDKRYLYVGFMRILNHGQKDYILIKEPLSYQKYSQLNSIISQINQVKSNLIKTPIITQQDQEQIEDQQEKIYTHTLSQLEQFCAFISNQVDSLVNMKAQQVDESQQKVQQLLNKKVDTKKQKETVDNQQQLSCSQSGIQSLCVLIDQDLQVIPFEHLNVFKQIPAKSRDYSLYMLGKKYEENQNSSSNLISDVKYVANDFKLIENEQNCNFDRIIRNLNLKQVKLNGIQSSQRLASLGEWQKYIEESNTMMVYSNQSVIDLVSPQFLTSMIDKSSTKIFMIFDKQNIKKTLISKQNGCQDWNDKIIHFQLTTKTTQLMALMNISQMVVTNWSVDVNETIKQIQTLLKGVDSGVSFAAVYENYIHQHNYNIYKHNLVFYGVPKWS